MLPQCVATPRGLSRDVSASIGATNWRCKAPELQGWSVSADWNPAHTGRSSSGGGRAGMGRGDLLGSRALGGAGIAAFVVDARRRLTSNGERTDDEDPRSCERGYEEKAVDRVAGNPGVRRNAAPKRNTRGPCFFPCNIPAAGGGPARPRGRRRTGFRLSPE